MIKDEKLFAYLNELSTELAHELHHGRYDTITDKAYELAHDIGGFVDYLDRATFIGKIEEVDNEKVRA